MSNVKAFAEARTSRRYLAIGLLVLAACAAKANPEGDPSRARFEKESDEIATRQHQCLDSAAKKMADRLSDIEATIDEFADMNFRGARSDYYWDVWQCQKQAERENEKVAAQERAYYGREQNQGRDNSALMGMLLSSRPH